MVCSSWRSSHKYTSTIRRFIWCRVQGLPVSPYTHTHKLTELQRQTSLALPFHRLRVEWLEHDAYFWLCHRRNTHRLHIYAKEHQNYPGCRRRRHAITQFYFYLRHTNTNTHTRACPLVHYCGKTCVCKCTARNYTVAGDSFDCRRPATVSTLRLHITIIAITATAVALHTAQVNAS